MPDDIAESHNKFWTRFSEVGVPKVLEQTKFLFVKNKEGYVYPYRVFVRFMYDPKYGYCFIGSFRKTDHIFLDHYNQPIRTKQVCFLILDQKGKIVEISKNFYKIFGISPQVLEKMHLSMHNQLKLTDFNPTLNVQNNDWSRYKAIYIPEVIMSTSNIV